MQNQKTEVLSLEDAAKFLHLSTKKTRQLVHEAGLPVLAHCRDLRVRRVDLEALFRPKEIDGKAVADD